MRKIFKYPLMIADYQEIDLPESAEILHVDNQRDQICLWASVVADRKEDKIKTKIRIAGTGHPIEDYGTLRHLGTVKLSHGDLVFHVFEIKRS